MGNLMLKGNSATRRYLAGLLAAALLVAGALTWWSGREVRHFIGEDDSQFLALFPPPPAPDSAAARAELDELLALQARRTAEQVAAARQDRKTRIDRFYGALGLDARNPPDLPRLEKLAEQVEDDLRLPVRAAKRHFRRSRPYVIEPRIQPCIDDVADDLSYPSGHATFGHGMALLLEELVPERRAALEQRAREFASQRMVCGVHFPSDVRAGETAARWLLARMKANPEFNAALESARVELRAHLPASANNPAR